MKYLSAFDASPCKQKQSITSLVFLRNLYCLTPPYLLFSLELLHLSNKHAINYLKMEDYGTITEKTIKE